MAQGETLHDAFIEELRDMYDAEKQLVKALPKMAEAARFDQLRELFELHLTETELQVDRLTECFELLGCVLSVGIAEREAALDVLLP